MDLICRTCLEYNDELEPLYTKKLVDTDYRDITAMIYLCTGLEISEDDQLSDTICTQCIDSIITAFKFRKKVWESNNVLLKASKMLTGAPNNYYTKSEENNTNIFVAPLESKIEPKLENFKIELSNLETLEAEFLKFEPPSFEDEIDQQSDLELSEATDEQSYFELGSDEKTLNLKELGIKTPDYQKIFKDLNKYIEIVDKSTNLETLEVEFLNFEPPSFEDEIDQQSNLECNLSEATDEQTYIELGTDEKSLSLKELGIKPPDYQKILKDLNKYIQIGDKSSTSRPYCCTKCKQTYEIAGPLYKHLLAHHNVRVLAAFRCKICLKTFIHERHIRKHLNNAHQPKSFYQNFVCDLCGKSFKHNSNFMDHLNRHNGIKQFQCDICQFRTVSNSDLKVHLRSHTNERPFVCSICNMGFKSSSHRSAHIKEAHSDNPHECEICGTEFTSWRNYRRHMQLHNNMNFECDICHKKFNRRRNLKLHFRHHGEKMFKCSVCEKAFHQKQNCKNHMKKAHNSIL